MGSVVGPLWILEDGYSMQFDGTDDYISVPSFTTSGDDLTLSFWFKAVNLSTGTGAFLYKDANNFVYYNSNEIIYCKINGTLSYIVCNVGGVPQLFNTGWHNLTITKTGTTETWYVDGVSYAHYLGGASGGFTMDSIGADGTGGNYFLDGSMDEISIWDSSLTSAQVIALYSNGRPIKLHDPPFNPIAWYRMGDNAVFKDPQWLLPENSNKDKASNYSMAFDGTDDYIVLGADSSLQPAIALTVSGWIKLETAGVYNAIVRNNTLGGYNGYLLWINTSNKALLTITQASPSVWTSAISITTFTTGVWYHVMGTWDGANLKIYINGVLEATTAASAIYYDGSSEGYIGAYSTHKAHASIDEVAVFNNDQSSNISFIYSGGTNGTPPDLSSLNPVGYWKMGENGTYKYPQWLLPNNENKDKESNYSLLFDGGDDTVNCGDLSAYDTGDLSFSVWIYKTTTARSYIINNSAPNAGNERGFLVIVDPWGGLQVDRRTPTHDATTGFNYPAAFTLNNWHHIVGVYEDTTYTIKLYLDGVLIDTDTGYASTNGFVSGDLYIGSGGGSVNWMVGKIDEVAVWDKELLAEEVTAIYNSGVPTDLSGESGLVDYWKMGDLTYSAGTADIWVVPDSSINNNTGFADNMTLDTRVGDAPNSINNALSLNMEIFDRVGDAPNSTNNALSYNMELSGRTTDVPT